MKMFFTICFSALLHCSWKQTTEKKQLCSILTCQSHVNHFLNKLPSLRKLCCPHLAAVMQHRMMKEAQRAMAPWVGGQPIYGPMSHASSQMNPLLYSGAHMHTSCDWFSAAHSDLCTFRSFWSLTVLWMCVFNALSLPLGSASGKSIPLKPMPLPPPQSLSYSMPPPSSGHGNHTPANTHQMLDYLESQVRGMDMVSPLLQVRKYLACVWRCVSSSFILCLSYGADFNLIISSRSHKIS